jgi:DNA-binding PadR family transcriptional regulator
MTKDLMDSGRFADPSLLILSSLAGGPKHGYAISKDVESFAGVSMQPATLYGAVARLETRGLIEPLPAQERRRPYRLTGHGAKVLAAQLRSAQAVVSVGLNRLAIA